MFDMHYDLLSLVYSLKDEPEYLKKVMKKFNDNNITGVCANLYFMSREEMQDELKIIPPFDVLKMFLESKKILDALSPKCKIIYSIEGCDYIKGTKELELLYKNGLNAILLSWNTENKYGSGNRSKKGLTKAGKDLIKKAIDLNMGIDLSHANKKTFKDIIKLIKKAKKPVVCYASHSNIYHLHKHPRNLTNYQLRLLKKVNGKLGLVAYPGFLTDSKDIDEIKDAYLKHIIYAVQKLGIDNVMISSDNMDFYKELNKDTNVDTLPFNHFKIKKELENLLLMYFKKEEIDKILYKNAETIYIRIGNN